MSRLFRLPASNPWHLLQLICQCNSDFAHHCGFKWQFISVSNIPFFIYNLANFVSLVSHFWCYHQNKCVPCQYKHSFICMYGLYLSKNENSCDLQPPVVFLSGSRASPFCHIFVCQVPHVFLSPLLAWRMNSFMALLPFWRGSDKRQRSGLLLTVQHLILDTDRYS